MALTRKFLAALGIESEKIDQIVEANAESLADIQDKLAKANAELKEALKGKRCNCMTYLNFKDLEKENAELKKQLGNLYEIIKRPYQFTAPRKIQMVKEAEQFLNNEVEK